MKQDNTFLTFLFRQRQSSKAASQAGFSTREWELLHGPDFDLTEPATVQRLKTDIRKHKMIATMLAPQCSSSSVVRDRTLFILDREFP